MSAEDKTEAAITFLRSEIPGLQAVYGFGSQFDGTARPDSDWDIAFLAEKPLSLFAVFDLKGYLGEVLNCDKVDLIDIRQAEPFFRFRILMSGQRIYCPDTYPADWFESSAMTQYQFFNASTEEIVKKWTESYLEKRKK